MLGRVIAAVLAFGLASLPALADSDHLTQRVTFTDGRATVTGRINGYAYVDYVFPVGADESMNVDLKTNAPSNYFNMMAPGETETAFFIGSISGDRYVGTATVAGDYTARVYLMRNAARRGESASFTLTIALGGPQAADPHGPDFADSLKGGPDRWQVSGLGAGETLVLHDLPDAASPPVTRVGEGALLLNRACRLAGGERWCLVALPDDPVIQGWAEGRFLREPAATP